MSKQKCKLEIGKFYYSFGGGAHPALIYEITPVKTYKSIKFGTTEGRHMTEIKPIQKGYDKSYVHNRPFEGTRKDYGDDELVGLEIDPSNMDLITDIKRRPSNKSARARKRY